MQQQRDTSAVRCNLPSFWEEDATGWFAHIESRFRAKRIFDQWDRFDLTVQALPKTIIRLNKEVIRNPDEDEPYDVLRDSLLHQHELTDFQKLDRLSLLGPLGSRKPTELLGEMMELCPQGEETTKMFAHSFISRLPDWLRVQLAEDDHDQVRRMAVKADKLLAIHTGNRGVATIAATTQQLSLGEDDGEVHAVSSSRKQTGRAAAAAAGPSTRPVRKQEKKDYGPSNAAREAAGVCLSHWIHGDKARSCKKPCQWQGN